MSWDVVRGIVFRLLQFQIAAILEKRVKFLLVGRSQVLPNAELASSHHGI